MRGVPMGFDGKNRVPLVSSETRVLVDNVNANTTGAMQVGLMSSALIEIYGTATSAKVDFFAIGAFGEKYPLQGVNVSTFETNVSGGMKQAWQVSVSALTELRVEVSGIAGGRVSVVVKAVS
ncbi:hypothetical protein D1872_73270 [compost metagenome]